MQLANPPAAEKVPVIESAINGDRLKRYMPAAGMDKCAAFGFYMWNCALSEAFYAPLHFAEIVCRNAIQKSIAFKRGDRWFEDRTFRSLLDPKFLSELDRAIADETTQHGTAVTQHHVASALAFGFWEHVTTKRFERLIWTRGISHNFPNAHYSVNRQKLHDQIESVRRWRNRIAHHRAIFDKDPMRKHQDTIELVRWVCGDTAAWVSSASKVPAAIALRPKP
jgi:hypothetical protein